MVIDAEEKQKLLHRLRRVEGQLRGLERMLSDNSQCEAVLTQLAAAKAALEQLSIAVISQTLREYVADPAGKERLDRLLAKFLKGAAR